jgi:hypothetical protein
MKRAFGIIALAVTLFGVAAVAMNRHAKHQHRTIAAVAADRESR